MKVVFMGTPEFAVPSLNAIAQSRHEVIAVVCQPDRERDKKGNIIPPPVKASAQNKGIPVYQFERICEEGLETLRRLNPDIMVTAAYGQILSNEILNIAKYGVINIHASLLPRYRGSSPVQHAIINGDEETGVTIMQTDVGLDTGDIISTVSTKILPYETAGELLERLSRLGAELVVETLNDIEENRAKASPQYSADATKCKLIKKSDGLISFNLRAREVVNFIHGMNPWPAAYSFLDGKRVSIFRAELFLDNDVIDKHFCGQAIVKNGMLIVRCLDEYIRIIEAQVEGKRRMSGIEMINGFRLRGNQGFMNERQ